MKEVNTLVSEIYNHLEGNFRITDSVKFEEPIHYQDKVLTDIDYYGYISDKNSNRGIELEQIKDTDILKNILYEIQMQC
jgi:hypothetical protein